MRLIDADALLKDVTSRIEFCEDILEIIDAQPSLDEKLESAYAEGFTFAESKFHERKKGKWAGAHAYCDHLNEEAKVKGKTGRYFPSGMVNGVYCDQCWYRAKQRSNFCPNCGADMRERSCEDCKYDSLSWDEEPCDSCTSGDMRGE